MAPATRGAVVIGAIARTKSGYSTPHANAWNPPYDGPTTAASWRTPSCSISRRCAATMSASVSRGKSGP